MPRWEYAVVLDNWKIDAQGVGENERRQALQVLNNAAADRWELVTVEKFTEVRTANSFNASFIYFFKREIL